MNEMERFNKHGYFRSRESQLRSLSKKEDSLSAEAANEIKHLKEALKELICIVEIHSTATNNNFAYAELDFAKEALNNN